MGIWNRIKSAASGLWEHSKGQFLLVRAMGAWQSLLGNWSTNRYEQVRHVTGWNYIGTRIICETFATHPPSIGYALAPEEATVERRALGRILTKSRRRKALTNLQPHEEIELVDSDHRLYRLFHRPNPIDTCYAFLYETMLYLETCGNSYIWKVRDQAGIVRELWVLPADWIRPHSNTLDGSPSTRFWEWFECQPKGFATGAGSMRIPAEDMIVLMYKNPQNKFDGLSPSQAVAPWIDVAESIDLSKFASFKNRAVTDLAIEIDPQYANANKDTLKKAQAEFQEKYAGEANAGKPMLLVGGKAVKLNSSNLEMDYVSSGEQIRDWCLAARRVSPIVAGIDEAGSYNNMITSRANFYGGTMAPKWTMIGQQLTEELAREFDERLVIYWPDITPEDPVQVLAERIAMIDKGVMSQNQWRSEMGWEPWPHGGDEPMVNGQEMGWVSGKKPLDFSALMGQMGSRPGFPNKDEQQEGKRLRFWVGKEWNESDHPRANDGKFGSGGGSEGTPTGAPSSDKPAGSGKLHSRAANACRTWGEKAKGVPAAVMDKAKTKVKTTYAKLEGRYGKPVALAVLGAGVLGLPLPVPGSSFITAAPVLACAELYLRMKGHKSLAYALKGLDWSDERLMAEGKRLMEELLADWDEKHVTISVLRKQFSTNGHALNGVA